MVNLSRWDSPIRELDSIISRFNSDLSLSSDANSEITNSQWAPNVDIKETSESYMLRVELPGVTKEDVSVTLENGLLTIRGEKKIDKSTDDDKIHRTECFYGSFVRSFKLPLHVDDSNVSAKYENGILSLLVPKSAKAKPKQIIIDVK